MMTSGRENPREDIREDNRQTQQGSPLKRSSVQRAGALQGAMAGWMGVGEGYLGARQAFGVIPGATFLPGKEELRTA